MCARFHVILLLVYVAYHKYLGSWDKMLSCCVLSLFSKEISVKREANPPIFLPRNSTEYSD